MYVCFTYDLILHLNLVFVFKIQKLYWWIRFIRRWLTWKLCRVVWTSRCNYRGWRERATGGRSQNVRRLHPQPTRQYTRSHLDTVYHNTLQEKVNSKFGDKRYRSILSDYLTLQSKECSLFQKFTIINNENLCENTYFSKAWGPFVPAAGKRQEFLLQCPGKNMA